MIRSKDSNDIVLKKGPWATVFTQALSLGKMGEAIYFNKLSSFIC